MPVSRRTGMAVNSYIAKNDALKTIFDIRAEQMSSDPYVLLLEIGSDHCSYGYYDKEAQRLDRITYHQYELPDLVSSFATIAADLENDSFYKIVVASAFPEAILVPHKYAEGSEKWLDALYLQPHQKPLRDRMAEWQIHTTYELPEFIYEKLHRQFNVPEFYHHYTTSIRQYNGDGKTQVKIHFNSSTFSVLVTHAGNILLAQTYSYATPLDVVYYLLKICYEWNLPQTDVVLLLSGLLEKNSALYSHLNQYFLHVQFAETPVYALPSVDHPPYYFHALFNLAACVS